MQEILIPYTARPPQGHIARQTARDITKGLPPMLIKLWSEEGRGIVIIDPKEHPRFEPGVFFWRDVQAYGALYLPPDCRPEHLWTIVGEWLDYFAGSWGGSARLSEGAGATAALMQAAVRLREILALGYAADFLGTQEPPLLFARALATYRLHPQKLSAADPVLHRWFRGTIFDEGFWRTIREERYG